MLVQVFLAGGIDSVSFLAPTEDATYMRLRPKLALPPGAGTPFGEDPRLRWHPSAAALAELHAEGKVSVMPAVGYEHPDQSHFISRHFYEVGALDPRLGTGWLGRYLDRVGAPDNPLQGLALDSSLAPSLAPPARAGRRRRRADGLQLLGPRRVGRRRRADARRVRRIGAAHARGEPALAQVAGAAMHTGALRAQLAPLREATASRRYAARSPTRRRRSPTSPSGSPRSPQMLAAGLPLRCVAITAPGDYDTHANQAEALGEPLQLTCDALAAFQRDLEARGLADRVLVHVWSEFGRRAEENAEGTDHGAAGLGLLIGTRAAGRMIGEFPGLDVLDEHGNLRATSDFRGVYAALLEQWLGTDAAGSSPTPARSRGRSWSSEGAARGARRRCWRRARPPAAAAPARMLVTADEWMLLSSRQTIKAGGLQIQVYNRGEDAHDLAARRVDRLGAGGADVPRAGDAPGELGEASWRLRSGKYRLWCTLRGHEAAGMRATLRAR